MSSSGFLFVAHVFFCYFCSTLDHPDHFSLSMCKFASSSWLWQWHNCAMCFVLTVMRSFRSVLSFLDFLIKVFVAECSWVFWAQKKDLPKDGQRFTARPRSHRQLLEHFCILAASCFFFFYFMAAKLEIWMSLTFIRKRSDNHAGHHLPNWPTKLAARPASCAELKI